MGINPLRARPRLQKSAYNRQTVCGGGGGETNNVTLSSFCGRWIRIKGIVFGFARLLDAVQWMGDLPGSLSCSKDSVTCTQNTT